MHIAYLLLAVCRLLFGVCSMLFGVVVFCWLFVRGVRSVGGYVLLAVCCVLVVVCSLFVGRCLMRVVCRVLIVAF